MTRPSRGQYVLWKGQWYRVLWAGVTRYGDAVVKAHTLPDVWPDEEHWIPAGEVEKVRKTKPPAPSAGPRKGATKLDFELDRRLTRED